MPRISSLAIAIAFSIAGARLAHAAPELTTSTGSLAFGNIAVGHNTTSTFTITNTGTGSTLTVSGVSFTGSGASQFSIVSPTFPVLLSSGDNATVTVMFAPTTAGLKTGTLTFSDNDSNADAVSLSGTGTASVPGVSLVSLLAAAAGLGCAGCLAVLRRRRAA